MPNRPHGRLRLHLGILDLDQGRLTRHDGEEVRLTRLELAMLRHLAARPDTWTSADDLHTEVWGHAPAVYSRAVDKTASRLRQKLERDPTQPDHLLRSPGEGFRLDAPAEQARPTPSDDLFGRHEALQQLLALVTQHRLVTVLGPGGIGKTTLVRALLARHRDRFDAGTLLVPLAASRTVDATLAAVGTALGLPQRQTWDPDALTAALAEHGRMLLVLDNVEQLPQDAADLIGAWHDHTDASILLTSRVPLGHASERHLRLTGLAPNAAVDLFLARARRVRALGDDARDALIPLVARLDHSPLAIERAAARAAIFSPVQLVAQLDRRFSLLRSPSSAEPRHDSLWTTIAWSWDLLTPPLRRALQAASLFDAPWTAADADAVFPPEDGWAVDALQALVDASLIHTHELPSGTIRFTMTESVRAFTRARHVSPHDAEARLAQHFAGLPAATDLTEDLDNVIVGALQQADHDAGITCCRLAAAHLRRVGPVTRALAMVSHNLQRPSLPPDTIAELHVLEAVFHRMLGDRDTAVTAAQQALDLSGHPERPDLRRRALEVLGLVNMERGQWDDALPRLREVLTLAEAHQDHTATATAHSNLGLLAISTGDAADALTHYQAALRLYRRLGDVAGEGVVLDKLCNLYFQRGDLTRSSHYGQDALAAHRASGNRYFEAIALGNLGTLHHRARRWAEAHSHYLASRDLHRALGNRFGACISEIYLASLHRDRGELDEARHAFRVALREAERRDSPHLRARAHLEWGTLELHHRPDEAAMHLGAARDLLETSGSRSRLAQAECLLAHLAHLRGDHEAAAHGAARARALSETLQLSVDAPLSRALADLDAAMSGTSRP